jgi:hypothetical protein
MGRAASLWKPELTLWFSPKSVAKYDMKTQMEKYQLVSLPRRALLRAVARVSPLIYCWPKAHDYFHRAIEMPILGKSRNRGAF